MGYRSEVLIALPLDKVEDFEKECPELIAMFDKPYVFNGLDKQPVGKVYKADWLKWFDDYPEVQEWDKWGREQESEDYRFVRAGEDSGDTEDYGEFGGNDIGVCTQTTILAPEPGD